ncbi:MAG: cytochrome B [Cyanobium sp. ELA507]
MQEGTPPEVFTAPPRAGFWSKLGPGGFASLLLAFASGLLLLGSLDGRWGRLPFTLDGEWIELHGRVGVLLALVLPLFVPYALTLGAGRLRRFANSLPLLALLLAVGSGLQMETEFLVNSATPPLPYALHLTAWLLLAVSVPLHLIGAVRRGGWPLAASMLSLRLLPHDGPLHWPGQLLRYVRRGR